MVVEGTLKHSRLWRVKKGLRLLISTTCDSTVITIVVIMKAYSYGTVGAAATQGEIHGQLRSLESSTRNAAIVQQLVYAKEVGYEKMNHLNFSVH